MLGLGVNSSRGSTMPVELMIQRQDKVNEESEISDSKLLKRGDVIDIQNVGFPWSEKEKNDENRIIIRVEDLDMSEAILFLYPEEPIGDPSSQPKLKPRSKYIDLDGLTLDIVSNEKELDRANWEFIFSHTAEQIRNREVIKSGAPVETVEV